MYTRGEASACLPGVFLRDLAPSAQLASVVWGYSVDSRDEAHLTLMPLSTPLQTFLRCPRLQTLRIPASSQPGSLYPGAELDEPHPARY